MLGFKIPLYHIDRQITVLEAMNIMFSLTQLQSKILNLTIQRK